MAAHNVNTLIYSSTCATYGEPDKMPITEETPQVVLSIKLVFFMVQCVLSFLTDRFFIAYSRTQLTHMAKPRRCQKILS